MRKFILPLVLISGWILPGFAHWFYGRRPTGSPGGRYKALIFFGIVLICSVLGIIIADFRFVRFADNPFYYVGQFGSGLTLLLKTLLTSEAPRGLISMSYFEIGLLYVCVGGILNLVILINLCSQLLASKPFVSGPSRLGGAGEEPAVSEQPAITQTNNQPT